MIQIKLCGLSRVCDIEAANVIRPEYIGFVFAPGSRRYVKPEQAAELRKRLTHGVRAVGVFVNETPERVARLLQKGVIDLAQLHGSEDEDYIRRLRGLTDHPLIQAFRIDTEADLVRAEQSSAEYILLDSGAGGTGTAFDWELLDHVSRPYFLAGGLNPENVAGAIRKLCPFGVDVSSGVETAGYKDREKMERFAAAVRSAAARKEEES